MNMDLDLNSEMYREPGNDDLIDRFSDVYIYPTSLGAHHIRCRIDGKMQNGERILPTDYKAYQEGSLTVRDLVMKYHERNLLRIDGKGRSIEQHTHRELHIGYRRNK